MGFSLGLNLVQSDLSVCSVVGSVTLFSVTSPIGKGIGVIDDDSDGLFGVGRNFEDSFDGQWLLSNYALP